MYDFQSLIFRSVTHWHEATSLAVVGIGLLCILQGFRFARFLLPLACAGGGLVIGAILVAFTDLPVAAAIIPGAVLGFVGFLQYRIALKLASGFTFGAAAQYLAIQLGLSPDASLIMGGIGLAAGFSMAWFCRRSLPFLVTIVLGAALLVVGFVGLSTALVPSLGLTFVDWSGRIPLMVPGLMIMLSVLGYSVQVNAYQGDVESGGRSGARDLGAS